MNTFKNLIKYLILKWYLFNACKTKELITWIKQLIDTNDI